MYNFNPFPYLKTSSFILGSLTKSDAEQIFKLRSDPRVNQYLDRPIMNNLDEANLFIESRLNDLEKNRGVIWSIRSHDSGPMMGSICLWNFNNEDQCAEIGFELLPEYQGKGVMQEALVALIEYGFNKINLNKIQAMIHPKNFASMNLVKKAGFLLNTEIIAELDLQLFELNNL